MLITAGDKPPPHTVPATPSPPHRPRPTSSLSRKGVGEPQLDEGLASNPNSPRFAVDRIEQIDRKVHVDTLHVSTRTPGLRYVEVPPDRGSFGKVARLFFGARATDRDDADDRFMAICHKKSDQVHTISIALLGVLGVLSGAELRRCWYGRG